MNIRELTAVAMLIAGVAMAFTALLMPPPGEIHDSVLWIFFEYYKVSQHPEVRGISF